VIIEIANLDDNELGLVDAVEGMVFQYGWESHTLQKATGPYGNAFAILTLYDLTRQSSSSNWDFNSETYSTLCKCIGESAGNHGSQPFPGDVCKDISKLNDRSQHLLVLLAGLTDESLTYPDGGIWHDSMSAGEGAMLQLKTFDLIYLDGSSCGHWTEHGKAILNRCFSLGAFPK
jgi:hypothetical protein